MNEILKKWNNLYRKEGNQEILNNPEFIQIIESVYHVKACHRVIKDNSNEVGVPCYYVNTPLSGKKITSSPFNFYPYLIGKSDDLLAINELITLAKKYGNKCYVEYKTFTEINAESIKKNNLMKVDSSIVSNLHLYTSYDEQTKKYSKSLRQNLRTTYKKINDLGITIKYAEKENELDVWYKLLVRLYRNKHQMITQPDILFKKLFNARNSYGMKIGKLLLAYDNGKIIGGIFMLDGNQHWEYSWAAYDLSYAKYGINTILVDHAIRHAIEQKVKTFGFGSSSINDKDLVYFKSRWGCQEKIIKYYYWNHKPSHIDLNTSFAFARTLYSYLPISLLKRIPKYVVPYIA